MTILTCPQRSAEWFLARSGRLCASDAKDMLATIQKGEAAARRDLRMRLVLERIKGAPEHDDYINADMQRGIDIEPQARMAYELAHGVAVTDVGFCLSDDAMAGCSPDGFVGEDGLVEIKCPRSAKHFGWWRAGVVPAEHLPQLRHQLWVTGRQWVDFVSFDPTMPERLQVLIVRLTRAHADIEDYAAKAAAFLSEVDTEEQAVRQLAA